MAPTDSSETAPAHGGIVGLLKALSGVFTWLGPSGLLGSTGLIIIEESVPPILKKKKQIYIW